ncbi:hypothetical protein B2J88_16275 [Rhodococcus sp. SRB_17]|uniref:Rv2732c family membrane protein n=1 Tax=Rhodococcus sp. OK302 TaxID=1882769 RepID=UPI000B93B01B|nr:hypothetical protein [Rhodococcus sp. OK302]NMM85904.1 hypothetical protein [Rhodococcus sp. SRB_17]OYD69661.1 hypothetical protein BDB13_3232 [Rhodococcus sp. OK302]
MSSQNDNPASQSADDASFEEYRQDLDAVERKIAGEIDPGARAMVVAVAVLVLVGTLALPHAGVANGWDVLAFNADAESERIALFSRIFVWFVVIFGIGFSMLALVTRRWALAWVALAGSAVASALGMMAVWSRQTIPAGFHVAGPSIGLIVGWFTVVFLTFHWLKVVWARTTLQLAAEEERRVAAAEAEKNQEWNVG